MLFLIAMGLNVSAIVSFGTTIVLAIVIGVIIVFIHAFASIFASIIASGLGIEYGIETGFYLSTVSGLGLVIAYVSYSVGLIVAESMVIAAVAMAIVAIIASHLVYHREQYIVSLLKLIPEDVISQMDYVIYKYM